MMSISQLDQRIDQYKIRKQVTLKSFTELFVAYDERVKRWVALELLLDDVSTADFEQEWLERATAVFDLAHPNIATIYQTSPPNSQPTYIASQLVKGFPLSQRLEQLASQPSPVQTRYALRLIHQVASALADAEEAGLLHFDLRPENIIIQPDDTISILDLQAPRNHTLVETMIGSGLEERLVYYAPEQIANKAIDGRSHVYTLGILLFEMLTGQLPTQQKVVWERLYRNLRQQPTELAMYRSGLSAECYQVVDRALQPERLLRYSSLTEMISALERAILAEEERQISPTTENLTIHSANLRNYVVYPAALALICGILLIGSYLYFLQNGTLNSTPLAARLNTLEPTVPTETITASPTASEQATFTPTSSAILAGGSGNEPVTQVATATPPPPPSETPTSEPTATQTAVPSPTNTATVQPTVEPVVEIIFSSVSVRTGPNTNYDILMYLYEGDRVTVLSRTANDPIWYNIRLADGRTGWLSAEVGQPVDDSNPGAVPTVATLPPSPTPTDTAVPPSPIPTTEPTRVNPGGGGGGGGGNPPEPRPTLTPPAEPPTLTPPRP